MLDSIDDGVGVGVVGGWVLVCMLVGGRAVAVAVSLSVLGSSGGTGGLRLGGGGGGDDDDDGGGGGGGLRSRLIAPLP